MAIQETKCAENFYLPLGPQGPRGVQGGAGPQGIGGIVTQGPQGPAGGNKIDINLQSGSSPYIEVKSPNQWITLAHFIFPGTTSFVPNTWRIAIGYYVRTLNNRIFARLGYIDVDGNKVIVADVDEVVQPTDQGFKYLVLNASSFNGLPADASNFFVEGKVQLVDGNFRTRYFATELR